MYRSILVPLDGSELGAQALPLACDLARHTGALLHLVYVADTAVAQPTAITDLPMPAAQPDAAAQLPARAYLEGLAQRLAEAAGRPPDVALLSADPAEQPDLAVVTALAHYATVTGTDLIIMTSHGHGGLTRHRFGSVATAMLSASPVSLLLLRPAPAVQPHLPARLRRLLLPLDGSAWAEQILAPATALALASKLDLTLLHVVDPHQLSPWVGQAAPEALPMSHEERQLEARAYLDHQAGRAQERGLLVHCCACLGAPVARTILTEALQLQADLIGLTMSAPTPRQHEGHGVVAAVLRDAQLPILLYRPS
jgi:nucleotide-binding universal stress UspA family protein